MSAPTIVFPPQSAVSEPLNDMVINMMALPLPIPFAVNGRSLPRTTENLRQTNNTDPAQNIPIDLSPDPQGLRLSAMIGPNDRAHLTFRRTF